MIEDVTILVCLRTALFGCNASTQISELVLDVRPHPT